MSGSASSSETRDGTVSGGDPRTTGAAVEVRNLIRIYREANLETVALRGIDLNVHPGEYVALVGRSGSGKSTLLNLIAGADRPSAGSICVDGLELAQASEAERARIRGRTIRHIAQSGNLVEFLDLHENLVLAGSLGGVRVEPSAIETVLGSLGLAALSRRRPHQLSGGEQQRGAIAIALLTRPRLLLADEITGELDRRSAAAALDAIDMLRASVGLTIIAVTHDPAVAARANRVLEITDGRLQLADGNGTRTWR